MTALGKLFRTTAFKLSLAYLLIFTLFAFFLLGYIAFNARRLIVDQVASVVEAETQGLAEQYAAGGLRRLVDVIEQRSRQPGASLYLVVGPAGEKLAGNIGRLPVDLLATPGQRQISYFHNDDDQRPHVALVRIYELPARVRLLVGHDLAEADRMRLVIRRAFGWSLTLVIALALLGGWFVTRRVLGRIDAMTDTTRGIMAGDLSGRLAIAGANDELDRLAVNLNAMLDRIEELMTGLKEVSDNIAHDLKTPLTRLRNGAEEALRTAEKPDDFRRALEGAIDEADNLIRVFNALLMIARAEAGSVRENFVAFNVAEAMRDVVELYEPVAEEAGVALRLEAPPDLTAVGSRELVGQALANLVDNALKYARRDALPLLEGASAGDASAILVTAGRRADGIEIVVADRGPGIAAADRARALERFIRLEGARTKPGFGLGLSLAAAIARLHGGTLRLEDNQPGLRAVLALPQRSGAP